MTLARFAGFAAAMFVLPAPAAAQMESYAADLSGAAEIPGPGDADGSGLATLDYDAERSQYCYAIQVYDIAPATAAHLHRGTAGVAGPPVLTLEAPGPGGSDGCVDVSAELRQEIAGNPAGFYVNVHTADHPDGAVRGQLTR